MKHITDIDDPRLVKALAHPIRVRIIALLEEGGASPKHLAHALDLPLENVSYHVRALARLGLIELERKGQVRGAVQHHYRLAGRPRITAEAWQRLPASVRETMSGSTLEQVGASVAGAVREGRFRAPESVVARREVLLDGEGFREASVVLADALSRIEELERRARGRGAESEGETRPAVVVSLLFERPEAASAP